MPEAAAPQLSATVVVLREASRGLEVLLLERRRRDGSSGPWVFPGGRVEDSDRSGATELDAVLRASAVRETREEAGLELSPAGLVPVARWITPELAKRRFDTWFFATQSEADSPVRVDGSEIRDHRWLSPAQALADFRDSGLRLAPPTFVTLHWLLDHAAPPAALQTLAAGPQLTFRPRICPREDGACMLYPGDAGYESGDPDTPGARHRCWSRGGGLHYERRGT